MPSNQMSSRTVRSYGGCARRLARVIAFCLAVTPVTLSFALPADTPQSRYHGIADYWRTAAKSFADGAAEATSETKKSVWTELAAYFVRGAAHFEELAEADDKAITAAKQRAASPGTAGSLPQAPRSLTPVQPLQIKPVMPTIAMPTSPQQSPVSPIAPVIAGGEQCRKDADVAADGLSFDELMRRKRRYEQCHVPELRAWADYDRARARDALARAEAPRPPASGAACGWNCPDLWQEYQARREKEVFKRESDLYREVADRLSSRADSIDSGAAQTAGAAAPDHPRTTERATASLCPALEKSSAQANGNDPYLLCDCFSAYLHGRLTGHYADMLERSEQYILSPASLSATPATVGLVRSVTDRFHWTAFPDDFLFEVEMAAPAAADDYECNPALRGYEIDRVIASWPREIAAGSGLTPPSPGQAAEDLRAVHNEVYRRILNQITTLWLKYLSEVNLGTLKIAYEQAEFDWTLFAKSGIEHKALYDALIASQTSNPIKWHPYLEKKEELCARDNEASYARLKDTSAALLDVAGAFRTARTRFAADLLEWQALADRDGWPSLPNEASLKTIADRLWQTSDLSQPRRPQYKYQDTISVAVPAPSIGSVEYHDSANGWNGTDEPSVFYRSHHSCWLWTPGTPPTGLYMTAWPKPVLSQAMVVDPQIANDIAPSSGGYFGPLSQATLRRDSGRITLFAHLFERGSQKLETYYSGADVQQNP